MKMEYHGRRVSNFVTSVPADPIRIPYGGFTEQHYYLFSATHHGDRDEFWVVWMVNGKEAMRWNARHLVSIEWEDLT